VTELKLEVRLPGRIPETISVSKSPFILGRQQTCDFVILAMGVSREHARIILNPSGWHVEDLGGKNGTYLDGRLISGAQPLRNGSEVTLGNITLTVISGGIEPVAAPPMGSTMVTQAVETLREDWLGRDETKISKGRETEIIERLNDLLEISNLLNLALSLDEIFARVKDVVFRHLRSVERLAVLIDLDESGNLELRYAHARDNSSLNFNTEQTWVSRSICQKAFEEAVAIQTSDAQADARFEDAMSIFDKGIRSAMAVPLWSESKVVGVLYADAQYSSIKWEMSKNEELGFFSALANIVASSIQRWILSTKLANESRKREKFERYHSPAVVTQLLAGGQGQTDRIDPKDFDLSVLMCDLVQFTRLSESLTPKETAELLNHFFDEMLNEVFDAGGTLDKFIGDEIMAFFGAPESQTDHAVRAVQAGLGMLKRLEILNQQQVFVKPLAVRIGINSGKAVVGDVGSTKRVDYTALGTTVNLAARIENSCPPGFLAISEETLSLISDKSGWEDRGEFKMKGISKPVRLYCKRPK
jgi:adenylate cyclase